MLLAFINHIGGSSRPILSKQSNLSYLFLPRPQESPKQGGMEAQEIPRIDSAGARRRRDRYRKGALEQAGRGAPAALVVSRLYRPTLWGRRLDHHDRVQIIRLWSPVTPARVARLDR